MKSFIPATPILGSPVTSLRLEEQIWLMLTWAQRHQSKVVCLANIHMIMEAYWNQCFAQVLQEADLVSPDGMPLVWMLRLMGIRKQNRVAGMDVFLNLCHLASVSNISVYFLGSQQTVLDRMRAKMERDFPSLSIAGMEPLPFRPLTLEEDKALIEKVNSSGAGLVFVCLGCPKQENWMRRHKGKIEGVMIGVGAVFAVYIGIQKRAPRLIREFGFEWLYRLIQEPRRLWRRYGTTIPPFIYLAIKQLLNYCKLQFRTVKNNLAQEEQIEKKLIFDLQTIDTKKHCKIGQILVRQNLLTGKLLTEALLEQKDYPNLKIGEILIRKNLVSSAKLHYYLKNQKMKLGELMVEKKLISTSILQDILEIQSVLGGQLGEIMIKQKFINDRELSSLLIEQYWRKNFGNMPI